MAIGDTVSAARTNNLQARVAAVLGIGAGTFGYGQGVSSGQVSVGALADNDHLSAIYADMLKIGVHQTGVAPSLIAPINDSDLIGDETSTGTNSTLKGIADFENLMSTYETNRFVLDPSQAILTSVTSSSRTSAWNGTISHAFNASWNNADAIRNFFNTGGQIRFTASRSGGSSTAKNSDWSSLLSSMGTVQFGMDDTVSTGTGNQTSIGYTDLTSSDQVVFRQQGSSYAENRYIVRARLLSSTSIRFTVSFDDLDTGNGVGVEIDENVDGTIQSVITQYRAAGTYITAAPGNYTAISNL
jgi:hypothetical protein